MGLACPMVVFDSLVLFRRKLINMAASRRGHSEPGLGRGSQLSQHNAETCEPRPTPLWLLLLHYADYAGRFGRRTAGCLDNDFTFARPGDRAPRAGRSALGELKW